MHVSTDWHKSTNTQKYGVASTSRLLKIISLFCKRALQKRRYSAKETCNFKEPTNRSHHLHRHTHTITRKLVYMPHDHMFLYRQTHTHTHTQTHNTRTHAHAHTNTHTHTPTSQGPEWIKKQNQIAIGMKKRSGCTHMCIYTPIHVYTFGLNMNYQKSRVLWGGYG